MLGKDGRLYDPDFDFDGDGKLNTYEYSIMDDIVFGHDDSNSDTEEDDDFTCVGLDGQNWNIWMRMREERPSKMQD